MFSQARFRSVQANKYFFLFVLPDRIFVNPGCVVPQARHYSGNDVTICIMCGSVSEKSFIFSFNVLTLEKLYMFSQTRFHSVPAIVSKTYIVFKRQNIKIKNRTF